MRGKRGLLYWFWSLTRASLVILLLWLWLRYLDEQDVGPAEHIELKDDETHRKPSAGEPSPLARDTAPKAASAKPDDLSRIKGIGPKTANVFQQAGISTFRKLADTSIQEIQGLLEKANYRLLDPSTWIEQARLAADGKWDELEQLQRAEKTSR